MNNIEYLTVEEIIERYSDFLSEEELLLLNERFLIPKTHSSYYHNIVNNIKFEE